MKILLVNYGRNDAFVCIINFKILVKISTTETINIKKIYNVFAITTIPFLLN